MTISRAKTPEHEAIYQRLRDMVLFGQLAPGQPVTILGLKNQIGAGMTPVREAIRRLTAEGALEVSANRRVGVPLMSEDRLEQIYLARMAIEPEMARRACLRMGANLVDELHSIDDRLNAAIDVGDVSGYLEFNYRFHFRLYAEAEADILNKIARSLWLQVGPSLRIMCGRWGTGSLPDKHEEAMRALERRAPDDVARLIEEDIRQGKDNVKQMIRDHGEI